MIWRNPGACQAVTSRTRPNETKLTGALAPAILSRRPVPARPVERVVSPHDQCLVSAILRALMVQIVIVVSRLG